MSFNRSVETGLAPAANHAMGWTPVGVSGILGSISVSGFENLKFMRVRECDKYTNKLTQLHFDLRLLSLSI
jgi:hypothetical protein